MNVQNLYNLLKKHANCSLFTFDIIDANRELINCRVNKSYLICLFASQGNETIVSQLIKAGANLEKRSGGGSTALGIALQKNMPDMALILINASADIKSVYNNWSARELTHMIEDIDKRKEIETKISERKKADAKVAAITGERLWNMLTCHRNDREMIKDLLAVYKNILDDRYENYTLLIMAAINGYLIIAEELIEAGVDLNKTTEFHNGNTALLLSIYCNHPEIAIALISAGADVSIKNHWSDSAETILHQILNLTQRQKIKELIDSMTLPNLIDSEESEEPEDSEESDSEASDNEYLETSEESEESEEEPEQTNDIQPGLITNIVPLTVKPTSNDQVPINANLLRFLIENSISFQFANNKITII